jgi:hypothetical protein
VNYFLNIFRLNITSHCIINLQLTILLI